MLNNKFTFLYAFIILLFSCTFSQNVQKSDNQKIKFTILQTNDVYEIAPLEGGKVGGMARVGQLKNDLLKENPNTISVMAGDFLNPSVIGTLKYEGQGIKGKQMVEAMNVAGIDLVTFGNHEFDLKEKDLLQRIAESEFSWAVANVFHQKEGKQERFLHKGNPIPDYYLKTFKDADGTTIKVAIIGACLNVNNPDYVSFTNLADAVKAAFEKAKKEADVVLALTHQGVEEDITLAEELQGIPLILGGHEHHHSNYKVDKVTIAKADANAKSAYIHRFKYNKKTGKLKIKSVLRKIDESIPFDPKTDEVVKKWSTIAESVLEEAGIDPNEIITTLEKPIDATEAVVRYGPSVVSTTVVNAMAKASSGVQGAFINCGAIRIDDILSGTITQYDIVRLLPYGGEIVEVDMKGSLLLKTLEIGLTKNVGLGGYLALNNLTYDPLLKTGTIGGKPIDSSATYKIATLAFLMTGGELNLEFLKPDNPEVVNVTPPVMGLQMDIRLAVIDYLMSNPIPTIRD